jgi:hypothetical protein
MKKCNYCHVSKSLDEFPLKKDGSHSGNCQSCKDKRKDRDIRNQEVLSQKRKAYYQDNRDEILEDRKSYYQENKEEVLARNKLNYETNKEEYLEYKKEYYQENKEHLLELSKQDRVAHPAKYLLKNAKERAEKKNLPFDITEDDIVIPEICPVFGIPIVVGSSLEERDNSPSLDRVIPKLGYVKGNVRVISFKANSLKRDGCVEDFRKIIEYINNNLK